MHRGVERRPPRSPPITPPTVLRDATIPPHAAVVQQTQPVYGYDLFYRAINGLPWSS